MSTPPPSKVLSTMAHDFYTVTDGLEVRLQEASQDIKDVNTENKSRYNMLQRDVQSAARDIANVALDLNKTIDDLADHKQLVVTKLTAVHQALTAFMCESQAQITRFEQHSMTQGENLKLQLADLSSKFTSYISRLTLDLAVVREATARNEEEVSTLVHEMRELKPLMVDILSQLQELQSARDDANSSASRSTELEVQFSGRRSLFDEMQASVSTEPALPHPALDDIRKDDGLWAVEEETQEGNVSEEHDRDDSTLVDEIAGEGNNVIAAQPGATPPESHSDSTGIQNARAFVLWPPVAASHPPVSEKCCEPVSGPSLDHNSLGDPELPGLENGTLPQITSITNMSNHQIFLLLTPAFLPWRLQCALIQPRDRLLLALVMACSIFSCITLIFLRLTAVVQSEELIQVPSSIIADIHAIYSYPKAPTSL